MRATLGIVIGTYNRLALLQKCLEALVNGVRVDHEIFIADAGSTDGTVEYLEGFPGIRLVRDQGRLGQAQSLNRIFMGLENEFICWLSDDNIVVAGALDVAVNILKANPRIGMVALKVKDITGPYAGSPYLGSVLESGVLNCNQGMLRGHVLRSLEGFDEEFRDYGIDSDLTTRVLLAGFKVVYTKQLAIHHFRNHEVENWVTGIEREERLERARQLYRKKYAELLEDSSSYRSSSLVDIRLLKYYAAVLGLFAGLIRSSKFEQWQSAHLRDLSNIANGRFISRWDLIRNIVKPYYLVQEIPTVPLKEYQDVDRGSKVRAQ